MSGYKLTGANGDEITFDLTNYVLNPTLTGFGIPPTSVRIDESARDGGTYRYSRRAVRNIDIPVTVLGSTAVDVENKLRRLARLTQDTLGATILTALRDSGNLTIELHYVGGAELEYGGEAGGIQFARVLLSFQAPNPYWQSALTQDFTITAGNVGRGLLPELTKLKVTSSNKLGQINVNNVGDVAVFPVYTVRGPIENFEVSNGTLSFGFNAPVVDGETIFVDTEAGTVIDDSGANRYSLLSDAPKLFNFPPGNSTIEITGTVTTADTFVGVAYNTRFEVVHG